MLDGFKVKATEPEVNATFVRMVGTGAAAPTKELGKGVTITRTAAGVYKLTLSDNPGAFVDCHLSLGAATPGDVKNHSLIWDTWDAATKSIEISLFDAAAAAHDLAAAEYIGVTLWFKRAGSAV